MNSQETSLITVSLGGEAHSLAQQFAVQQTTPQKGKRVYLNTLAVYAVHIYLEWLMIDTNLNEGESWHPGRRTLFDIADLVVPSLGKLECRPVLPGETTIYLSPEATLDRAGYIGVQFADRLNQVQLLGFVKASDLPEDVEQIVVADFQPLDTLFECISQKMVDLEPVPSASNSEINLSLWQQNIFENDWRPLNQLYSQQADKPVFAVRSGELQHKSNSSNPVVGISGGKVIDLGILISGHPFTLIVTFAPSAEGEVDILTQLFPVRGQIYLPEGAQLVVLDAAGEICIQATARVGDNWIQLEFSVELGERFSIQVIFADASLTEYFVS